MTMVSSLRSGPNNYKFCYCLGKGNQGSVFCAQNLKDGDFYAVKALSALPGMSNDLIQKEISIHKRMSHPNIIKYYESM
jgi:serine/threonine protein kinase